MRTHLIAVALLAAGCGSLSTPEAAPAAGPSPGGAPSRPAQKPAAIAAITADNRVVVLDPTSGRVERTLAAVGRFGIGSGLAVSPDGRTVYYSVPSSNGCLGTIWSVPAAGGTPVMVAAGDVPAVSPDGSQLAYARNTYLACTRGASDYSIVVRKLGSGHETVYPASPGVIQQRAGISITDMTWAADSRRLAVGFFAPTGRGVPWRIKILDTGRDRYYVSDPDEMGIPLVSGPATSMSFYRDGTFLPNGNLFVSRDCCNAAPVQNPPPNLLCEVDTSGLVIHQVAIDSTYSVDHSLRSDATGRWLLYIAGKVLYVSVDGHTPTALDSASQFAAWIEP